MNSLESTTLKAKGAVCYLKVSTAEQAQQNNSPVQESKHCTSNNLLIFLLSAHLSTSRVGVA